MGLRLLYTIIAASLLLSPSSARASDRWFKQAPVLACLAGNALDLASTEYALARLGNREANPVVPFSRPERIAIKSGTAALSALAIHHLMPEHPTLARWLGYSIGGSLSLVAIHNIRLAQ